MRALIGLILLIPASTAAQKPWEQRVNIAIPVPVELPSIPPHNPFAAPVDALPTVDQAPLTDDFPGTFAVAVAAYIDATGTCLRAVVTDAPLPGLAPVVVAELGETRFIPAVLMGAAVPAWITLGIDLTGRIEEGLVARLQSLAPDPAAPPRPDSAAVVGPDPRDLQLPATAVEHLDRLASPKRFRLRSGSLQFRQSVRLLAEISERGTCERVVFLSCPEGLRRWLLASIGAWTFRPATRGGAAVTAWVILEGDLDVETSSLAADTVRVLRQTPFAPVGS